MTNDVDLFEQINNAVLDLQGSHLQTFDRSLRNLANLLHHPDLETINHSLTDRVDFDAFLAASEKTGGGFVGTRKLAWPDSREQAFGLTLILIDRLAADPNFAVSFAHQYYYSGQKIIAGIHSLTGQLLIPFVRDYRAYVLSKGNFVPRVIPPTSNKVFIVHGHDDAALQGLARFLEKLGLEAIVLKEQPDRGRTIIEKFEDSAIDVGFAVVLLTPDDLAASASASEPEARARQNVIFELGFFAGKLGRGRVCLLRKGHIEIPSDLFGVIYTDMDAAEGWKPKLVRELKAAKLDFDANKIWD